MALTYASLNVYPYGGTAVTVNEGGRMANYALTAHTLAATLVAFPAVGSGGTAGIYTPAGNIFIAAIIDSDRAHFFYTDGNSAGPNFLPTLRFISQLQITDTGKVAGGGVTTALKGGFQVGMKLAALNLFEANSPTLFTVSEYAALLIASTSVG